MKSHTRASLACLGLVLLSLPVHAQTDTKPGGPASRIWGSAEYLLLWTKSAPVPTLVTTGPLDVLGPNARPGTLGLPGTVPLINGPIPFGVSSGARFTAGAWLSDEIPIGVHRRGRSILNAGRVGVDLKLGSLLNAAGVVTLGVNSVAVAILKAALPGNYEVATAVHRNGG